MTSKGYYMNLRDSPYKEEKMKDHGILGAGLRIYLYIVLVFLLFILLSPGNVPGVHLFRLINLTQ